MTGTGYSGFEQVGASGATTIHVKSLTVNKSGYLYIFFADESHQGLINIK